MNAWKPVLFATTLVLQAQAPASKAEAATEKRLRRDVTYLAAPERKGRGNGYPDVESVWRRAGVKPDMLERLAATAIQSWTRPPGASKANSRPSASRLRSSASPSSPRWFASEGRPP